MKSIVLFAGSNSSTSINKQLIDYTATLLSKTKTTVIDLRSYEPPMFSVDLEKEIGIHPKIQALLELLEAADGVVVSTPEHNSMPPAFFKNILDWLSRVQKVRGGGDQYLQDKPVLLMSSSPGKGGAKKSRDGVKTILGHANPSFIKEFSLPLFKENFKEGKIVNEELDQELKTLVVHLEDMFTS